MSRSASGVELLFEVEQAALEPVQRVERALLIALRRSPMAPHICAAVLSAPPSPS